MANRFWVGGTGTWDASDTTHWAALSGAGGGSSVPAAGDVVTFDASSGGGTATVNTNFNIGSLTIGAFTGTLDFSANNNSPTFTLSGGFSGSGTGTRTLNLGSGTFTLSSTTANSTLWNFTTATNLTLSGASATIDYTGAVAAGRGQNFSGGGQTYGTVKISGARLNSGLAFFQANTIGVLNIAAAAYVSFPTGNTITTLTQGAQLSLFVNAGATLTITNAPTLTGSVSAPLMIGGCADASAAAGGTISCGSGTFSGTWVSIADMAFAGGATFTFTNSFDNGKNTGATITAPRAPGMLFIPKMQGNVG